MTAGRSGEHSRDVRSTDPPDISYEALLDGVADGVYLLNRGGYFRFVSESYLDLTGYSQEDLLTSHISDVVCESPGEPLQEVIGRVSTGTTDQETITQGIETVDGETIWVETQLTSLAVGGDDTQIVGYVEKAQPPVAADAHRADPTDVLDAPSDFIGNALDEIDDIFYVVGPDRRLIAWNDHLPAVSGYTDEELDGMDALDLLAPNDREQILSALAELLEGNPPPHQETELVTKTGDRIPISLNGSTVEDTDGPARVVGVARDISTRKARERELKRYEALFEESTDVNAVLDANGTFTYITPSVKWTLGYDQDALEGERAFEYIHPEDRELVETTFTQLVDGANRGDPVEFRFRRADGSWAVLEAGGRNLLDDPVIQGVVVYTHEVTERRERERQLKRHRERLAALNNLNAVVREITGALLSQSTRSEVEQLVCEQLAAADSYKFAWIGGVKSHGQSIELRAEAGVSEFLEDLTLSIDPDHPSSEGPTAKAIRTGEIQIVQDARNDSDYELWQDRAEAYGYHSSAAVPLAFEGSVYGVLNIYTDRPNAFAGEEREMVRHLGETVGHALGSIERKQALTSDEIVELEFQVEDFADAVDLSQPMEGSIIFTGTVPLDEDQYIQYGQATESATGTLSALVEENEHWDDLIIDEDDLEGVQFRLMLSNPPVISSVADHNGRVQYARLDEGSFEMLVHLPPSADVRGTVQTVQAAYPDLSIVAQRRTSREPSSSATLRDAFVEDLTDRQQTVLEAAYYAGFFDWPRRSTGEELASALGISAATFHEHVRNGERKLLAALLDGNVTDR